MTRRIKIKPLKHWFPCILWAAVIFYLSSQTSVELPLFPFADKIAHIGIYTIFGFFVSRAFFKAHNLNGTQAIIAAMIVSGLYGLTDEIHQMHVPPRSAEALDLMADFMGGFLGALTYGCMSRISKKSQGERAC